MRIAVPLLRKHITLFTKDHCGLCVDAKQVLHDAWDKAPESSKFDYSEVDISKPENKKWFDLYAFDVPVAHIESDGKMTKQMHRLKIDQVIEALEK